MNQGDRIDPLAQYRADIQKLLPYLSWLEAHRSQKVVSEYQGEGVGQSFTFPVYDSTLLAFVKTARASALMDRNYPYVYSRNQLRSVAGELQMIRETQAKDIGNLRGILSHYVIGGATKGGMWPQAVADGVFYEIVFKLQELVG